ncbi:hypothetical protein DZA65_01890 [Dickeya dianthicola]|nr:hypothetical protein DZA65_01890 [Dickeya dianthicola]
MRNGAVTTWRLAKTGKYQRIVVTGTANAHDFMAADTDRRKTSDNNAQFWWWRTARRNSCRVFWLDLNKPPSDVVVVALVASRIPRALTQ